MSERVVPIQRAIHLERVAKRALERLIDAENPVEKVQELRAQDLFLMLKEVGLADVHDIVPLVSPEQFQTFIDLDGFRVETDPEAVAALAIDKAATGAWLEALLLDMKTSMQADGTNPELFEKIWKLDIELLQLWLREAFVIHAMHENEDPYVEGNLALIRSPDGMYLLEARDEVFSHVVALVLELIYRHDAAFARQLLDGARTETLSDLVETVERFREGRLADLGFASRDEALELLIYRDPDAALPKLALMKRTQGLAPGASALVTRAAFEGRDDDDFLARALRTLMRRENVDEARGAQVVERFAVELAAVTNRAISALGFVAGDTEGLTRALAFVRASVSLALEYKTVSVHDDARDDAAADLVGETALLHLFQCGHSLTLQRARRAARVMSKLRLRDGALLVGEPLASHLRGLVARPSLMAVVGPDPEDATRVVVTYEVFSRLEHLAEADLLLLELELIADALSGELGLTREAIAAMPGASFSRAFNTIVARRMLGLEPLLAPISAQQAQAFAAMAFVAGAGDSSAGAKVPSKALLHAAFELFAGKHASDRAAMRAAQRVTARFLAELRDEMGALDPTALPDPRFIAALWVRQGT